MCDTHYTYTMVLVSKGKYTWEQLEKDGKSLPLKNRKSGSMPIRQWLDGGSK